MRSIVSRCTRKYVFPIPYIRSVFKSMYIWCIPVLLTQCVFVCMLAHATQQWLQLDIPILIVSISRPGDPCKIQSMHFSHLDSMFNIATNSIILYTDRLHASETAKCLCNRAHAKYSKRRDMQLKYQKESCKQFTELLIQYGVGISLRLADGNN